MNQKTSDSLRERPEIQRFLREHPNLDVNDEFLQEFYIDLQRLYGELEVGRIESPEPDTTLTKDLTSVIVMPDLQIPYVDWHALDAFEQYMADHTWDWYINIGDFIDVEGLSRWTEGSPRLTFHKELVKEYQMANDILDRHQRIIREKNPDAKFHYIFGNHEERVEKWLDRFPTLAGLIEIPQNLALKERGFTWTRDGHMGNGFILGHATFTHGEAVGMNHAKKMAETWGGNVFYGHVHDTQSHTLTTRKRDVTRIAQSLGCLCQYNLPYMQKKPSRWQQGFGVFYFQKDGSFNHYVPLIMDGKFISPGGKYYEGRLTGHYDQVH